MNFLKRLLYLGNDTELYDKFRAHCFERIEDEFEIDQDTYSSGNLLRALNQKNYNIVYVDFTRLDDPKNILDEVIFIKRVKKLKGVLFVAILDSSTKKEFQSLLYSSGFQLGYIKGAEVESFFADSLYIGLGEKITVPKFAKASEIELKLDLGVCSSITSTSSKQFCVETDLGRGQKNISLKLEAFEDLEITSFEIGHHQEKQIIYPMTDSFVLNYPLRGPWDKDDDDVIEEKLVKDWLEGYKENFLEKSGFVKVITQDMELVEDIFRELKGCSFMIDICEGFDFRKVNQSFESNRPPLIFVDLEEEGDGIDDIVKMIDSFKDDVDYEPIVVIANTSSKAVAMQKVYDYEYIACIPHKLTSEILSLFMDSFLEKSSFERNKNKFYFKTNDEKRAIDLYNSVKLTSLTEHELTFISKVELPIFSVLHLTLPIDCFITIVPYYYDLDSAIGGRHYLGFIHSLSEKEKQVLRKFVNQMIYDPITEISTEVVEKILEQKNVKESVKESVEESEKDEVTETKKEIIDYRTFERPSVRGKSKL